MKGIAILRGLEINLTVNGEEWEQGQHLDGFITIKNMTGKEIGLEDQGVYLVVGDTKKMKAKKNDAFTRIAKIELRPKVIASSETIKASFKFELSEDCMVSEKTKGPYIITSEENPYGGIQLRLLVTPHQIIKNYIDTFENLYRFKFKTLKNKKNWLEAVLVPPAGKDFDNILSAKILLRFESSKLNIKSQFKIKKLDFASPTAALKEEVLAFEQSLGKNDYFIYGDSINQEGICGFIDQIINKVKFKPIL